MNVHPYLAVRQPLRLAAEVVLATALVLVTRGLTLPVARLPEGANLTEFIPSPVGRLALALPAVLLAWSCREPCGEIVVAAGRRLLGPLLVHHATAASIVVAIAALAGPDAGQRPYYVLAAVAFLGAALLSSALWGPRTGWGLPAALLALQLLPVPLPARLGSWAWDGYRPYPLAILAGLLLVAGSAAAIATHARPLLAGRGALARLDAAQS